MILQKSIFSVLPLSVFIKAKVGYTLLRLGFLKWLVLVYWKIVHNMQQVLPSSASFAKQLEELERRFHHNAQTLNKTKK